jgi:hypothetical protein
MLFRGVKQVHGRSDVKITQWSLQIQCFVVLQELEIGGQKDVQEEKPRK